MDYNDVTSASHVQQMLLEDFNERAEYCRWFCEQYENGRYEHEQYEPEHELVRAEIFERLSATVNEIPSGLLDRLVPMLSSSRVYFGAYQDHKERIGQHLDCLPNDATEFVTKLIRTEPTEDEMEAYAAGPDAREEKARKEREERIEQIVQRWRELNPKQKEVV
jgi:hypothetical protein